jgi:hypothetical protein
MNLLIIFITLSATACVLTHLNNKEDNEVL